MTGELTRRRLLRIAGGVAVLAPFATACTNGGAVTETDSSAGTVCKSTAKLPAPFTVPLPVPPVLRPDRRADAHLARFQVLTRDGNTSGP